MEKKNKKIEKNSAEIQKKSNKIQKNSAKNQEKTQKNEVFSEKIQKKSEKSLKNTKNSRKIQENLGKIEKNPKKSENFSQKSEKNIKKPAQNTNLEIYNYLNLVDRRLGKLYKHSGFSPLPANFFVDEKVVESALVLGEMKRENFEDFEVPEKKAFKKMLKISLKNCKRLQKNDAFAGKNNLSTRKAIGAAEDFETYLVMRQEVTHQILKDLKNHDFDETAAYAELFNLNPIFGEILDKIFQSDFDEATLENLPQKYNLIYDKNLKSIAQRKKKLAEEKQKNKKTQQQLQALKDLENLQKLNNIQKQQKLQEKENLQKNAKISAKTAKKVEKTAILQKNLKNKQDAKAAREQNSKNKIQSRSK